MKLFKLIQHSEPRICATFWLKLLLSSRSSLEKAPLPMGNCARQLLYWIAKFPRTALEFSANPTRSRTIGWPTSFSCYRYRPGEIRISGSKSRPCRRALPLVTIFSVTSLFSLSSSLPFSLSSLLPPLSLFLPCLPLFLPSFLFSTPFSRWFMLLVWLWRTLGFTLRNGIVPGLRNVFDGGYGPRRWKKLPNVASNGECAFFSPVVTCRAKRT